MEDFNAVKLMALTALSRFNVNVGLFYGCRDTALAGGLPKWVVSVKGQGLPEEGFTVGREKYTEAITDMAKRLKAHKLQAEQERIARDRAKRGQEVDA